MTDAAPTSEAFHPGRVWLDTSGTRIHAHGGSVIHEDGVFHLHDDASPDPPSPRVGRRGYARASVSSFPPPSAA